MPKYPPTWKTTRLEEVCNDITVGHVGPMAEEYVDDGIPFLRSQNIEPFRINPDGLKFIDDVFHAKLKKCALAPGDVAVVRTGYPGTAAVIPDWLPVANCADLVVIRPSPAINPHFLVAILNSKWGQSRIAGQLVGVAQQHFNIGTARRLEIPLPPLGCQLRIAHALTSYDDLIENNTKRIRLLKEMACALYREWFVNFRFPGHEKTKFIHSKIGKIPGGWIVAKLEDVSAYINRGVSPKYADDGPEWVINQKCIRDQQVSMAPARRHRNSVSPDKYVRRNDVLINSTGVGTLGRVAQILDDPENTTVDTHVSIVRPSPTVDADFFGLSLLSLEEYFESQGAGATGQTELARTRIAATEIVVPQADIQRRFGVAVHDLRTLAVVLAKKNANLRATRDLLLPRLISGEIDVSSLRIESAAS